MNKFNKFKKRLRGGKMKEKAAFEAGIKLGALFHQFIGVPVSLENVGLIEKAIESSVKLQPYVDEIEVRIDREKIKRNLSQFGYTTLKADMIYARVRINYKGIEVEAELKWDDESKYPLMRLLL